jgi:hypothetical protein
LVNLQATCGEHIEYQKHKMSLEKSYRTEQIASG